MLRRAGDIAMTILINGQIRRRFRIMPTNCSFSSVWTLHEAFSGYWKLCMMISPRTDKSSGSWICRKYIESTTPARETTSNDYRGKDLSPTLINSTALENKILLNLFLPTSEVLCPGAWQSAHDPRGPVLPMWYTNQPTQALRAGHG
jgi:hypothetical protein